MQPALLVLTDTERFPEPADRLAPLLKMLPAQSVGVIVRDRALSEARWLKLAEGVRALTERTQQLLIVGTRFEHAERLGAFGVHLPSDGASPRLVREQMGLAWVSRSYHGVYELPPEERNALSAVLVSPALAPRKGRAPIGLVHLSEVVQALSPLLAYALGGVGPDGIGPCLKAGASGVAMIEAAFQEPPERIERALRGALAGRGSL